MFSKACILLTEKGTELKIFMGITNSRYYEIKNCVYLEAYQNFIMVKNHYRLFEKILQSNNTPRENLEILREFQDKIRLEKGSPSNSLKQNLLFLHENTKLHPDHAREMVMLHGISGWHGSPYDVHDERLCDMIKFLEEYCFAKYESAARRNYINGFKYQQIPWTDPKWILDYCQPSRSSDFDNGRKQAKITSKSAKGHNIKFV
ncbi:MAG TPA: hypothetical protein VFP93_05220 [Gammaproteobacteria bacterium]|nr:hypothetical protein [Gammaproteobacteria bacterium]